jgi:hypothetical protein
VGKRKGRYISGTISLKLVTKYGVPVIVVTTCLTGLALLFNWLPFLRGGYGWRWPYVSPGWAIIPRLVPGIAVLGVYLLGAWKLRHRRKLIYLGWVLLGTILLPVALLVVLNAPFYRLYTRTVSSVTTGGYTAGSEIETLAEALRQWPSRMAGGEIGDSIHMTLSPPGWPVLYYSGARLFAFFPTISDTVGMALRPLQCDNPSIMVHTNAQIASAWLGILSPVWGALTVLPLYGLGRRIGSESVARTAAAWWLVVPALSLFMATLNTPYPFMATAVIALLVAGLTQRSRWRAFVSLSLAGCCTAVCLVFNFSFAPLILMCGWLMLLFWQENRGKPFSRDVYRLILVGVQFAVGLVIVLGAYWLITGHHLLDLLLTALKRHLELERPYLPWLWLHTWDVAIFVGLPFFGLFLLGLVVLPRCRMRRVAIALSLTLLTLVVSGTARGETGRVWMFFMPFMLLVAADVFQRLSVRWRVSLLLTQFLWLFAMVAVLRAVKTDLTPPPAYAQVAPPPLDAPLVPVGADFAHKIQLIGYQAQFAPEEHRLTLVFAWKALRRMERSYLFSILAVSPKGDVEASTKWLPLDQQYPTTCWYPENTERVPILDRVELDLGENPAHGNWWLSFSAFALPDKNTPVYLPVTLPNGHTDDRQVGLGPIRVQGQ